MFRQHIVVILWLFQLGAILYLACAVVRLARFRSRSGTPVPDFTPPVTLLKPLCGTEPGLEENLRSFCVQDYPAFQVVFGVRGRDDPAIPVAQRIIRDFPHRDMALVVTGRSRAANPKVANLLNMLPSAKHELLIIADSDMRVGSGYLRQVAGPFAEPEVGAVTCLYGGLPHAGLPSRLFSLYISDWFLPSVLVATWLQPLAFCFGSTMAVRREALEAIGGLHALAPYLADDYMLGRLVRKRGYAVRLSPCVVETVVHESSLRGMLAHELRWARTIRCSRPMGYFFSFLSNNALSLAAVLLLVSGFTPLAWAAAATAMALRTIIHFQARRLRSVDSPAMPWLLPLRDMLCLLVWLASYFQRSVRWRDGRFTVQTNGHLGRKHMGAEP